MLIDLQMALETLSLYNDLQCGAVFYVAQDYKFTAAVCAVWQTHGFSEI